MNSKEVLREWLEGWKTRDAKRMAENCQMTWLQSENNPVDWIENYIQSQKLLNYTIINNKVNDYLDEFEVKLVIVYNISNEDKKKKIENRAINVICETAPYKPDKKGIWGVNPISSLRRI